jgi:hypothetical protein
MLHDMANGRKLLFRSLVVLILLGGVLAGGWAAYMWYIYSHNSGLTKVAKGKAYKMTKTVKITPCEAACICCKAMAAISRRWLATTAY